jgi:hypothetical protein
MNDKRQLGKIARFVGAATEGAEKPVQRPGTIRAEVAI